MSFLLDLIFPPTCLSCGRLGDYICPYCQRKLAPGQIDFYKNNYIEAHLPIFANTSQIKQPIYQFKYKFTTHISHILVRLSTRHLSKNFPKIIDYWRQFNFTLTPIPLHHQKLNWRGFNQSAIIAQALATNLHLDYIPDLLLKPIPTLSQAQTKTKSHRLKLQIGSFSLNPTYKTAPSNLIIFDDIFTTGATSLSAAKTFGKNKQIWILTLI